MGSNNLNFRNFAGEPPNISGNNSARPPGGNNIPLTRQSSVYSLTFDEFQSAVGGSSSSSKDLGSMNMDELLKSIWTAEENQNLGSTSGGTTAHQEVGNLSQKQGSLTLPRTLSQKTVEEVWRDMAKEYGSSGGTGTNVVMPGVSSFGVPQREPTLGEVTLEEFLARAGVAREDAVVKTNNLGFFGDFPNPNLENLGLGFGFQQQQEGGIKNVGLVGNNRVLEDTSQDSPRTNNAASNVNTAHQKQQPQRILPKQPVLAFGEPIGIRSNGAQLNSPHVRKLGISDQATNSAIVQNAALGMSGLGPSGLGGGVTKPSTPVSSDGLTKNGNGDASSVSPIPYLFSGGGMRGRKSAALEKVIERRQRRMIKNRESAARSRARKQAYTMELEAEVAKLKEENEELQKKQAEMMEMQKNQELEMMNQQNGPKRQCLRRTQTGPW